MKKLFLVFLAFLLLSGTAFAGPLIQSDPDIPSASTSVSGRVELATDTETVTGTSDSVVCTPGNLTAKMAAPGAIGGTTPANGDFLLLTGNLDEIVQAASDTLGVAELRGQTISNFGQGAADNLQTLPTAAEGMSFLAVCGTAQAANYFGFQADTNDKIYLNGTAGSDNGIVKIAAPVVGAMIYFFTFKTGATSWDWAAITIYGVWVAA